MATAADVVSAFAADAWKKGLNPNCTFEGIELRYIHTSISFYAASLAGSGPGLYPSGPDPLGVNVYPSEAAAIISKLGIGPSKSANGTLYFSGLPEQACNGSALNASGYAMLVDVLEFILSPISIGPAPCVPVVMSRTTDTLYPMAAVRLNPILGHQRSRRPVR
jgi:hypothetical protein